MKKEELLKLNIFLNSDKVKGIKNYPLFSYIVKKAKDLMEIEVSALKDITKEFETDRDAIYFKYAEKDDKGNPIVSDNKLKIPKESFESIKKDLNDLMETHKKALETFDKVIKEESDVALPKINVSELKGLELTTEEIEVLYPMLKYEEI